MLYCCLPPDGEGDAVSITLCKSGKKKHPVIIETATSCLFTGDVWVFLDIKSSGTVTEYLLKTLTHKY